MESVDVNLDFFHLIQQGAISTYPLLACSVIMLGVVIERLWSLRGAVSSTAGLTRELVPLLARGDLQAASEAVGRHRPCPARRVFHDVLAVAPAAALPDLERVADERQFEEIEGCGAYLWILGTIGSSAPFIGLFGTVIGIIRAFHSMALVGTGGFGVVAGGISEALIATALGLAIGIVALVFYNYLQNRVERIDGALRIGSGRLLEAVALARRGTDGAR
jgi:biopolymer transport protein ExbB